MEKLLLKSQIKIKDVSMKFKRYLFEDLRLSNRFISIKGARGTGKTTLLLQIGAHETNIQILYVALDDLFFTENSLYELAEKFVNIGGELLLLDEVHKYPNWSRELKLIYDDFPSLQIIFTSSSMLDIYRGEADLSRRVISYNLKELSFREFLLLQHAIDLPKLNLEVLLKDHNNIALSLVKNFKPLKYFSEYLKYGAYPYYLGNKEEYYQQILNTINLILEVDVPAIQTIDYQSIAKIKRLLYVLSTNVPFIPNISKLSEKIGLNRNALVQALQLMNKAELIHVLYKNSKSISVLNKPDKIWMNNTNLSYAIGNGYPDVGNLRETFFLSQLQNQHLISLPEKGDFFIDGTYVFEVGGKNKKQNQLNNQKNAFIVKDDIESGIFNTIPLWLFGLLY